MKERLRKGDKIPFAQIANSILNDPLLSLKGKGLYAYLYSKPDKWDFSSRRIIRDHTDGRDSILSGLQELESRGYLRRKKLKNGRVDYAIFQNPKPENPTQGKAVNGKTRPVSNKELEKQKEEINIPLTPLKRGKKKIFEEKLDQTLALARPLYEEECGDESRVTDRLCEQEELLLAYVGAYLRMKSFGGDKYVWRTEEDYLATLKANLSPLIRGNVNVSVESFDAACLRACTFSNFTIKGAIKML